VTVFPVMLEGARFSALVVGGGAVAARKVKSLLDGGIAVTVVAPSISSDLRALADPRLTLHQREYDPADIRPGMLVIAATDDAALNGRIGAKAIAAGCLVNVVDDPRGGNFVTAAVHRAGDLTVAVSTGRTPAAAAAIRNSLAPRFDARYASAIGALRTLRDKLLRGDKRDDWQRASKELIGDDFCAEVEQGTIEGRIASWR
jgi:precorrin-2 dehydrogenase/sirohydrochlorin ferrochelatase